MTLRLRLTEEYLMEWASILAALVAALFFFAAAGLLVTGVFLL